MADVKDVKILMPGGQWRSILGPLVARIVALETKVEDLKKQVDSMSTYEAGDNSIKIT